MGPMHTGQPLPKPIEDKMFENIRWKVPTNNGAKSENCKK